MASALASERIARHGFADRPSRTAVEAVELTTGLQAQDPAAGRLGVRARCATLTDADVRRALDERTIVKASLMRATIHLVSAQDVRWLTELLGPGIARSFAKRWLDLGLTPQRLRRTAAALPEILADGPRTRPEVAAALTERGIAVDAAGQASTHVMLHATTEALVCRGPDRGREATYVLLDEWAPTGRTWRGDDALAEIARRYFTAFGPATGADFTTWSGLPSSRAIALIRDELDPVDVGGRPGYRLGCVAPGHGLRLLPAFDNYLVGYRDRSSIIDPAVVGQVYVGGVIRPSVLLDGRVVGTWRLARSPGATTVEATLLGKLGPAAMTALEAEAADLGRFLDVATRLAVN